jgi:hypothetical protein
MYSDNPHRLDEWNQNILETVTSIEVSELKVVSNNFFRVI